MRTPFGLCLLLAAATLPACTSQERLTAQATSCSTREVNILTSEFARRGSTTAWCAECKGKTYQCASNADQTKVHCRELGVDEICR